MAQADKWIKLILAEYERAASTYPPMHSPHEGYATLKEEVDELWDEVKKKPWLREGYKLRKEAIQVTAMGLRFLVDLCELPKGEL